MYIRSTTPWLSVAPLKFGVPKFPVNQIVRVSLDFREMSKRLCTGKIDVNLQRSCVSSTKVLPQEGGPNQDFKSFECYITLNEKRNWSVIKTGGLGMN